MSKDRFALAYSVRRMARARGSIAPQVALEADMNLPEIPDSSPAALPAPADAPVAIEVAAKPKVDIAKLIKKHRFFGSK